MADRSDQLGRRRRRRFPVLFCLAPGGEVILLFYFSKISFFFVGKSLESEISLLHHGCPVFPSAKNTVLSQKFILYRNPLAAPFLFDMPIKKRKDQSAILNLQVFFPRRTAYLCAKHILPGTFLSFPHEGWALLYGNYFLSAPCFTSNSDELYISGVLTGKYVYGQKREENRGVLIKILSKVGKCVRRSANCPSRYTIV